MLKDQRILSRVCKILTYTSTRYSLNTFTILIKSRSDYFEYAYSNFLNIKVPFVPPNPNELLRAVVIEASLDSWGT